MCQVKDCRESPLEVDQRLHWPTCTETRIETDALLLAQTETVVSDIMSRNKCQEWFDYAQCKKYKVLCTYTHTHI